MKAYEAGARKRILDAAEDLITRGGLEAADLPAVAGRARVSQAAVRGAFCSAPKLAREVFSRRLDPLDEERLRLLRCAESLRPGGRPFVERILRAYMVPWIRFWQTSNPLLVIYARHTAPPPGVPALPTRPLETEVADRFTAALARALPGMSAATLAWRLHFIQGAILRLWADPEDATRRSGGLCTFEDIESVIEHLVAFASAGLEPGRYGVARSAPALPSNLAPHSSPRLPLEGPHGPSKGALPRTAPDRRKRGSGS